MNELTSALEAVLFAAGDSVPTARLSLILGEDEDVINECISTLQDEYASLGRGIRILRLDDKVQMCSAPKYAGLITKVLEQRKPAMLSQSALETLAIVAYFQPVTRAYIEQVRGVDSSYTVGMLQERGLIEECGRLEVPGRPAVFRTTDVFLRTMGVENLSQLPPLPEINSSEGLENLQDAIEKLKNPLADEQIAIGDLTNEE